MANDKGLYTAGLNVERFIRINNLQECTDPIYLNKNVPTAKGVLSYEIFGTSQYDRQNRMAYIDLHGHYMVPLAATMLYAYSRTLNKVLYGQGTWKLQDGELVEDPDGGSGPEFLYSIWGKVKVKDKDTVTTKEIQEYFEGSKDNLFTTKYPVIPAFLRDLNTGTGSSTKSSSEINSWYSSIISYAQSLSNYTDILSYANVLTRSRIQTLLVTIFKKLMIDGVKGSPSKYGMLRRSLMGKNVNYSSRMVITAPNLMKASYKDVQVKYGYGLIPLAHLASSFMPYVIFHMKQLFDQQFIMSGKLPITDPKTKEKVYVTIPESYSNDDIHAMIVKFLNSPSSRFDKVVSPPDTNGNTYNLKITGRFGKENTTIERDATITDVLYMAVMRAVEDKHTIITRYPLDNYNGQFPAKIDVASTIRTEPAIIGNEIYSFFPICIGKPDNKFIDTLQFSNVYLDAMGGDYDGDMCSSKPVYTKEANGECKVRIQSVGYAVGVTGKHIRTIAKDFILTAYNLTSGNKQIKPVVTAGAKYNV